MFTFYIHCRITSRYPNLSLDFLNNEKDSIKTFVPAPNSLYLTSYMGKEEFGMSTEHVLEVNWVSVCGLLNFVAKTKVPTLTNAGI